MRRMLRSLIFRSSIKSKCFFLLIVSILVYIAYYFGLVIHLLETDYYTKFSYPLDIRIEDILIAVRKHEKLPFQPINEYEYKFNLQNERKCLQGNNELHEKVVILYVIKSALENKARRDAIRNSWGWENRFSDVTIRRIFMLGVTEHLSYQDDIDEEYARHKDIVQANFIDSYYNNTIKTMMSFKWVINHCPAAQFIMFSDDDMYISTKNLLKFIRNPFNRNVGFRKRRDVDSLFRLNISQVNIFSKKKLFEYDPELSAFDGRLYSGYVFESAPMRHKFSKWYISLAEYPFHMYPPYVTAGAYVMSYPALVDMYHTSMFTKHFKFDDVYLGIVAKKCGISPLHNKHFYFWKKPYSKESYSDVIASHGFSDPEELKKVWEEQRYAGNA